LNFIQGKNKTATQAQIIRRRYFSILLLGFSA